MSLKKSKKGKKCSYCEQEAKWHNFWSRGGTNACDEHKEKIKPIEDNGRMSEADYMTWGGIK